jgi:MFS family permease
VVLFSNADQNLISPNLDPILLYFGFNIADATPIGYVTSFATVLTALSMVIFGISADKYSRKWICFWGSLAYCSFSILTYFTPSGNTGYVYFFFVRAMNGFAIGCVVPTIFSLMGDLVKPADRSKVLSWVSVAGLLGQGLGLALASGVYEATSSWQLPFLIIASCNMACALFIPATKEPVRGAAEAGIGDLITQGHVYSYKIRKEDLRALFERKSNLWLIINFVSTIPAAIILFLLFRYMQLVHGVDQVSTFLLLIVVLVGGILGNIVFGALADRSYNRGKKNARVMYAFWGNVAPIPFAIAAFLIPFQVPPGASIAELFQIPGLLGMIGLLAVALFLNGAVGPNWYSSLMDVNLPEHRGTMVATANLFDLIGKSIAPLFAAYFDLVWGTQYGILSSVLFWVILPLFWIEVLRHYKHDVEEVKKIIKERTQMMAAEKLET